MKFELNEYHKTVTDEELLQDIKRVAELLHTDTLSRTTYLSHGKYHASTVGKHFGSWTNAMKMAGISASEVHNTNPTMYVSLMNNCDLISRKRLKDWGLILCHPHSILNMESTEAVLSLMLIDLTQQATIS